MAEGDSPFHEIRCPTWDALVTNLERRESGWIFRGERDATWRPQTSLERHVTSGTRPHVQAERMLLEQFQRRAHLHLAAHHVPSNLIDWLALLQHWGGPTRLLDFTASPYVAAYFAVEDAVDPKGSCAVWAVDKRQVWQQTGKAMRARVSPSDSDALSTIIGQGVGRKPEAFQSLVWGNHYTCVLEVVPTRLSERSSLQQGVFLCPGNVNQTFEANLAATGLPQELLVKFVLPHDERGRALERLRAMNITRATLFPGLEGLAQSFRQHLTEESPGRRQERLAAAAALESLMRATSEDSPDSPAE